MKKKLKKFLVLAITIALTIGVFYFIYLKTEDRKIKQIANIQTEEQEETVQDELINISECSNEFMEEYFEDNQKIKNKENVLIVSSKEKIENTYGAVNIVEAPNNQYFIEYNSEEEKKQALEQLKKSDEVLYVEENNTYTLYETNYNSWGITTTSLDYAINMTSGKELNDVTVAIIDSGCDMDLFNKNYPGKIVETYNAINSGNAMTDELGHGTHIAGTIAEGTPANVKILPVKASQGDTKELYDSDIIAGINYIVHNNKADVINMSFGSYEKNQSMLTAVNAANNADIICVAAAGNEETSDPSYPAAYDSTISISSVDPSFNLSWFSSYGPTITFAAPGSDIVSINGTKSGTSMATPHAVCAVAILKSYNNTINLEDTINILRSVAIDLGEEGRDDYFGYGLISFSDAVFCDKNGCDGSECDEFCILKYTSTSPKPGAKLEIEKFAFSPYNFASINNILATNINIYYNDAVYITKQLWEVEDLEIKGYDPYCTEEQTIEMIYRNQTYTFSLTNPYYWYDGTSGLGWEYTVLDENSIEITKHLDDYQSIGKLYIPEAIDGYKVVSIGKNILDPTSPSYNDYKEFEEIILPKTVTKLSNSFKDAINLTKVISHADSIEIEEYEFSDCEKLETFNGVIAKLGSHAFENCKLLNNITLSSEIINIPNYAFNGCENLKNVNISNSATSIGMYAFSNCNKLETIDGEITELGNYAFENCSTLNDIVLADTIKEIPDYAFNGCENLKNINIPNNVTSIGTYAFSNTAISELAIPKEITQIGERAFYNCTNLETITVDEDNESYDSRNNCNAIVETLTNKLLVASYNTVIPDTIKIIGEVAFCGDWNLKGINIPEGIEEIQHGAFYSCINLEEIKVPESVILIGENAFNQETTIWVYKDSYAKTYAEENSLYYKCIDASDIRVSVPKKEYKAFETVDTQGMSIYLGYDDGRREFIEEGINIKYTGENTSFRYGDTYFTVSAYSETGEYIEKQVSVTVNKATPKYTIPTDLKVVEGQTLSEIKLPSGFEWMDETQIIEGFGNLKYKAKYTPEDTTNYETIENIEINIEVKSSEIKEITAHVDKTEYKAFEEVDPQDLYIMITYESGRIEYIRENIIIEYSTGKDSFRYGDTSFIVKALNAEGNLIEESINVIVQKVTPQYTIPSGLNAIEGQRLLEIKLPNGFEWMNKEQKIENFGGLTYKAKYIPEDTTNYEIVENIEIYIYVKCTTISDVKIYGIRQQYKAFEKININDIYIIVKYQDGITQEVISDIIVKYKNATDSFRYGDTSFNIRASDSNGTIIDRDVDVTVVKATSSYTVPTGISAYVKQQLSQVKLPQNFEWMDKNQTITAVGKQTYYAKFVPTDTINYEIVENIKIVIDVKKIVPKYTIPTGLEAISGQMLSQIKLPDGFKWMDETQIINGLGTKAFKARYIPKDTTNYETIENIEIKINVKSNIGSKYVGNINSELITFKVGKNQSGATYVSGQVVVVEWVNGKSTVPRVAPKMKFKSTDGKVELEVFVTPTGTNTYYFDRFIEGIDTSKQYFFEIESGDANNVSPNKKMNVYFTNTKYNNTIVGKYKDKNIRLLKQNIIFEKDTYIGNINSELKTFNVGKNQSGATYVSGQVVVVEWINGKSTVPKVAPKMKFKSTDGKVELEVFVTPTGTNTYYFDRFIEGIDTSKQYYFEIASGDSRNISENRKMNVYFTNTKYNNTIVGKYKNKNIRLLKQNIIFENDTYIGNINSELKTFNVGKNQSGATYVSGQVVVVEWINGKSTVPKVAPKMKFKSTDGKVELEVFVTPTGTNTYYFDRFIEGIDTSKQYYFEIASGDGRNISENRKMNVYFTNTKYNNTIVGKYKNTNIRLLNQNIIFEK